mgnify:CR=1 FL=1
MSLFILFMYVSCSFLTNKHKKLSGSEEKETEFHSISKILDQGGIAIIFLKITQIVLVLLR